MDRSCVPLRDTFGFSSGNFKLRKFATLSDYQFSVVVLILFASGMISSARWEDYVNANIEVPTYVGDCRKTAA